MKTCPYCKAEIANNAKKCKFCGERLWGEEKVQKDKENNSEVKMDVKKKKIKNDENEEIDVSFDRRIFSILLDCFFIIFAPIFPMAVWIILCSIFIGETPGTYIFWINLRNKDWGRTNLLQKILNTLLYFPIILFLFWFSFKIHSEVLCCIAWIRGIISFINSVASNDFSIIQSFWIVKKVEKKQGMEKYKCIFGSMIGLWLLLVISMIREKLYFDERMLFDTVVWALVSVWWIWWLITTIWLNVSKKKNA